MEMRQIYQNLLVRVKSNLITIGAILAFSSYLFYYLIILYIGKILGLKYLLFCGLTFSISLILFGISKFLKYNKSKYIIRPIASSFFILSIIYPINFLFNDYIQTQYIVLLSILIPIISMIWCFVRR